MRVDGERHFITTAPRLGIITRYVNRPFYPQGNGRVERSFKTDEEEFYQVDELPTDFSRGRGGAPGAEPRL